MKPEVIAITQKLSSCQNEKDSTTFAIIPVKRLTKAKSRLSPLLAANERKQFCLKMLEDVLIATKATKAVNKTIVVSKDLQVLQLAEKFRAFPFIESRSGLNQSILETLNWCASKDAKTTLIYPADIPLVSPEDTNKILTFGKMFSMVICPSRGGNGTNALLLNPFRTALAFYGQNSFQRYIDEASKRGISFHIYRSPRIALDIDTVKDLADFVALNAEQCSAYKFLMKIGVTKRLESYRKK